MLGALKRGTIGARPVPNLRPERLNRDEASPRTETTASKLPVREPFRYPLGENGIPATLLYFQNGLLEGNELLKILRVPA